MDDFTVKILPLAWQDIDQISDYYLSKAGAHYAKRITDRLLDTISSLSVFPFAGARLPDPELARQGYRKILCDDYICIYKIIEKAVYVYRVVNGRRDYPKLLR